MQQPGTYQTRVSGYAAWTVRLVMPSWQRTVSCMVGCSGNCLPKLRPVAPLRR